MCGKTIVRVRRRMILFYLRNELLSWLKMSSTLRKAVLPSGFVESPSTTPSIILITFNLLKF